MSQQDAILEYLKAGNSLTGLESLERFKCWRLASRISQLKKEGHNIEKQMIELPSGKHVAEYRMAQTIHETTTTVTARQREAGSSLFPVENLGHWQ